MIQIKKCVNLFKIQVEVSYFGWPVAFMVATADIESGAEIFIDKGENYWERQRVLVERLGKLSELGKCIRNGVLFDGIETEGVQPPRQKLCPDHDGPPKYDEDDVPQTSKTSAQTSTQMFA